MIKGQNGRKPVLARQFPPRAPFDALGFTVHFGPFNLSGDSWLVLLEWTFGVAAFFLALYMLFITVFAEVLNDVSPDGAIKSRHFGGAAITILMTRYRYLDRNENNDENSALDPRYTSVYLPGSVDNRTPV